MKYVNIIGILLILIISTLGNRIAPGRYCTYFNNDTLRACGPTTNAENDKQGFWVFLEWWWNCSPNLYTVVNYENNLRQGWQITFQIDSMQTRGAEIHYANDTIDGEVRIYNDKGQRNLERKYTKGEMYYQHFLNYSDYVTIEWIDGKAPSDLDSAYEDMLLWSHQTCPFIDESLDPYPNETIVVFNSWTNKITYIIIAISSILLILNLLNINKNANKRNH